jgi:hypothetical protein
MAVMAVLVGERLAAKTRAATNAPAATCYGLSRIVAY